MNESMTMTLEQFTLDYINKQRSVTFGELQEAGQRAGYSTHGRMEFGHGDVYLWGAMSEEFALAVRNLIEAGRIDINETTKLDCLVRDPIVVVSKDRWIPCRLEAVAQEGASG